MQQVISFVQDNAGWLFGSTSAAALLLGILKIFFGKGGGAPDKAPMQSSVFAWAALALLFLAAASSGYFVITGGDAVDDSTDAGRDATRVEGRNVILSGERSTNVISEDGDTVINPD